MKLYKCAIDTHIIGAQKGAQFFNTEQSIYFTRFSRDLQGSKIECYKCQMIYCQVYRSFARNLNYHFKALESQALSRAYFLRRPFRGPLENSRIFSNISFDYF